MLQLPLQLQKRFKLSHRATSAAGSGRMYPLTQSSERAGIKDKWFALTGRVVAVKAETDGYLHIELQDARLAISRASLLLRCRMRVDSSSKASECRADRIELDEGNFSMFSR